LGGNGATTLEEKGGREGRREGGGEFLEHVPSEVVLAFDAETDQSSLGGDGTTILEGKRREGGKEGRRG